ncbi:efflux RND transporter periplasmic adaptor subunit [Biomaibacter acetigenes]|uniref:Efflux RND transporter periplasmic adaptor subunit n=1 Tax=Biomaibacter acetigenes TaxID=2316383 RepID=A0A3G2R8Y7_9FIRM|nr:efflux RND transporter periplasmic adaptor subunit [Biomaibacter acetigenes]AYO31940.1 efflux RND transporter periplasmic adaptor subunit [Biomaibacter acetigenes]
MSLGRKNKIIASLLLFFFVASVFLLAGCSKKKEEVKEEAAVPVKVMKTAKSNIEDIVTFTGQIEAGDEVKVVGKISGRVKEVNFEVGDYVQAGEPLVILETDELYDQLSQAEATLASAKANLAANESGSLPQQLDQVKSAFEQAEANYLNVKADYERMKALYEADAISKQAFDGMELKYKVAKSQYESAKEQLKLTEERMPKNVEALRAQVAQAQAAVDLIKTNIENSVIKAPVSGMISSKQIQPGEMCQAGATLGAVVNIDRVKVVINVPEEDINKLKDGQEATVNVDALGNEGRIKSKISIVSPASGASRLFQVKIEMENKDHRLKPGMFANVNVVRGIKENVITIPKDAVLIKKHGNVVYVVKEGKAEERLVKIGVTNGGRVEITEGLKEGETVVTSGQNMLTEGSAVKI